RSHESASAESTSARPDENEQAQNVDPAADESDTSVESPETDSSDSMPLFAWPEAYAGPDDWIIDDRAEPPDAGNEAPHTALPHPDHTQPDLAELEQDPSPAAAKDTEHPRPDETPVVAEADSAAFSREGAVEPQENAQEQVAAEPEALALQ